MLSGRAWTVIVCVVDTLLVAIFATEAWRDRKPFKELIKQEIQEYNFLVSSIDIIVSLFIPLSFHV
jgi:hypothetical protein